MRRPEARSEECITAQQKAKCGKRLSVSLSRANLFGPGLRKKLLSCFGIHVKTCVGLSKEMGVRLVEMLSLNYQCDL